MGERESNPLRAPAGRPAHGNALGDLNNQIDLILRQLLLEEGGDG